jgi:hypothetical protein
MPEQNEERMKTDERRRLVRLTDLATDVPRARRTVRALRV